MLGTLTSTTTPIQSETGSNIIEELHHIPQCSKNVGNIQLSQILSEIPRYHH